MLSTSLLWGRFWCNETNRKWPNWFQIAKTAQWIEISNAQRGGSWVEPLPIPVKLAGTWQRRPFVISQQMMKCLRWVVTSSLLTTPLQMWKDSLQMWKDSNQRSFTSVQMLHTHTHSHALTCTGQTEIWAWNPVWGWQHVAAITAITAITIITAITAITTLAFWNDASVTCTACAALTRDGWLSWMPFRMRFRMPFPSVIGHTKALVSVSFGQRGLAEVIWSNGWPVERMDHHLHVRVWALRALRALRAFRAFEP